MKSISEALTWRYATKQFDITKKVTEEAMTALLNAARLSPSWYGVQPWKFVVVENPELRTQLRAASYDQPQVTDASHFVVFTYKTHYDEHDVQEYIESTARIQSVPVEQLTKLKEGVMGSIVNRLEGDARANFAINQTHIALGFFLEAAALMGIDTCPMGGFDPNAYDDILGLKEHGLRAAIVVAVGYRSEADHTATRAKSRFSLEEVVIRK
jgi:nitroreductase